MSTTRVLAYAAFALVPAALGAQQPKADTTQLDPVVVTPTRTPVLASKASQPVTVLDGEKLRARGVTNVAQALREVPGLMVVQSGSYGGVTSVFVRGGESRYAKVLIDGVPVNTVGGAFYFQNLTLDNVDRIEVLRGPGSAVYGADALSGVIQIFTKRGAGAPSLELAGQGGTYGTRDGSVTLRGGTDRGSFSIGGSSRRTDGIYDFNNLYKNNTATGAFTLTPDALTELSLVGRYTTSEAHYPTDYAGAVTDSGSYNAQRHLTLAFDGSRTLYGPVRLHVLGTTNEVEDDAYTLYTGSTTTSAPYRVFGRAPGKSNRRGVDTRVDVWSNTMANLSLGWQYEREWARTVTLSQTGTDANGPVLARADAENARYTRGFYTTLQGELAGRLGYDASLRYDDHSDYKKVTTYHTGLNLAVLPQTRVRVSYGTAFNAPAFYQSQGSAYNDPNLDLQPERTHSVDVAIEQSLFDGRVRASVGAFDQHFSQLIQYVYDPAGSYYDNLTQARAKGYETELHALILPELSFDANYTQTIARVYSVPAGYSGMQPGSQLIRRPSHSGAATLGYTKAGIGGLSVSANYVGKRPDVDYALFPSPTITLPSYVKVDVAGSVDVFRVARRTVAVTARIDNVTNKTYQDVANFRTPGRAILMGARLTAGL